MYVSQLPDEIQNTIRTRLKDERLSEEEIQILMKGPILDLDIVCIWNTIEDYILDSIYGGVPEEDTQMILDGEIERKEAFINNDGSILEIL